MRNSAPFRPERVRHPPHQVTSSLRTGNILPEALSFRKVAIVRLSASVPSSRCPLDLRPRTCNIPGSFRTEPVPRCCTREGGTVLPALIGLERERRKREGREGCFSGVVWNAEEEGVSLRVNHLHHKEPLTQEHPSWC